MKHLISIHDLSLEEVNKIFELSAKLKKERKQGIPHPLLKGKTLGMIFT